MRCSLVVLLCIPLISHGAPCSEKDDPRAIIEKAIAAQGGEKAVAKVRMMRRVIKGSVVVDPNLPAAPMTYEDLWQLPLRYRSVMETVIHGVNTRQVDIINGDEGWTSLNGKTQRLTGDAHAELLEGRYAEGLEWLLRLREKDFDLSVATEEKVGERPALGVTVKAKGHRSVTLYFDRETMLLVKRVNQVRQPDGRLVVMEVFFSDHQYFEGAKLWTKSHASLNGRKFVEGEVSEVVFPD